MFSLILKTACLVDSERFFLHLGQIMKDIVRIFLKKWDSWKNVQIIRDAPLRGTLETFRSFLYFRFSLYVCAVENLDCLKI